MIEAALAEMQHGRFRSSGKVLAQRAGCALATINLRFGSIELLRRRLARERWRTVAALARLGGLDEREQKRLVWLIMTGTRPDLPIGGAAA